MRLRYAIAAWAAALLAVGPAGCGDDSASENNNNNITVDSGVDSAVDAGPQPLDLDLGELATVEPDPEGRADVTLLTEGGDEEYLVLLHSRAPQDSAERAFTLGLTSQKARRSTSPDERIRRWGCLSAGGHVDLAEAAALLEGLPVPRGQLPLPAPLPPPNVGEMVSFEINSSTGLQTITAEVVLVTAELVVAVDRDTDPTLVVDASDMADIAAGFADPVLPRLRIFFGDESDVNDDGHVTVLFSPFVAESASAYVNPYDLVTDPAARPPGVAANDQELLYVSPPQLLPPHQGTVNGIIETLAHEFQHAIYFYRKYILNATLGTADESPYITEGLSALAQDLSGYQAGNFHVSRAGLDEMDSVSVNDLVRIAGGYVPDRDGALRGGAYNLLRYLYDQAGGDVLHANGDVDVPNSPGIPWLRAFVDSPLLGTANVEDAAGLSLDDATTDWYIAQMVDDRLDAADQPLNTDPRYNYLPQTADPITGRARGTSMFEGFPFANPMMFKTGPLVREFDAADGAIRLGGAEYLHLTANASPHTTFTVAADPEYVDLRVVIFRIR